MVISKVVRRNKTVVESSMDTVLVKPPTQKELILEWIKYNPNEFLANEMAKDFPRITRRVIEKVIKEEVMHKRVSSKKCLCGVSNIYHNKKTYSTPDWT